MRDYPEFKPNLTPKQIFTLGSFGGTYWRPIYSIVTKRHYKNQHVKIKALKNIPTKLLTGTKYDKSLNKYKVKVGTSLRYWEKKKWITKHDPYGWVQWYCKFHKGKRGPDDRRQIDRWLKLAGPKGRFKLWLVNMLKKKRKKYNDMSVSPKIRQTLQHWGYRLTAKDLLKVRSKSA
jgi:hypothetical protein